MRSGRAQRTLHQRVDRARLFLLNAAVWVLILASARDVQGQTKSGPALRKCGGGVELRLSAPAAAQGGLLLVVVRSNEPLLEPRLDWGGKTIPSWKVEGNGRKRGAVVRALAGVDLERPAGKYELNVSAKRASGAPVACKAVVAVKAGHFAVERLKVEPKFVEPGKEDLERAEKERQKLREIFAAATPEKLWQGRFRLPLDGSPSASNFGRRRVLNGQPGSPHGGADFPALTGTPVHAAQSGRVALAEALFFSGNTVVIDHGLGIYTFYGHLDSIVVAQGDTVEAGALIGRVGATGRVTGPHLHWGLTVNQARVNPVGIVSLLK